MSHKDLGSRFVDNRQDVALWSGGRAHSSATSDWMRSCVDDIEKEERRWATKKVYVLRVMVRSMGTEIRQGKYEGMIE